MLRDLTRKKLPPSLYGFDFPQRWLSEVEATGTLINCKSLSEPIERCWAALENYWHGAILDSITAALEWAIT